jgi:beta-galactosidase
MKTIMKMAILLVALTNTATSTIASPREHLSLDQGWKFHLGDDWPGAFELRLSKAGMNKDAAGVLFDDVLWRTVNLPHDWVVELPFDEKADRSHGFKPVGPGFQQNNVGWYRREFEISASDVGKRIQLQFDGIYRDARVFVNGWETIHHESGYSACRIDITDIVHSGKNTVAVRVDASEFEGWFYEGAGIYRHVWLDKTDPVAIAPYGVFVTSAFEGNGHTVPNGPSAITAMVTVANRGTNTITSTVGGSVIAAEGGQRTPLSSEKGEIAAGETRTFILKGSVSKPRLWSPETPSLYLLSNTVSIEGRVTDQLATTFGIRTVAFDKDLGFLLNGKPYPIYGTCNHQDHAGVGSALPEALQDFRIQKLKEFSNAYRCSHNPPTPELLDACDRLGMIVMDENRILGSGEQNLDLLRTLILRDRNHPSVFIWSLCNEEYLQTKEVAGRVGLTMQRLVKQLDPHGLSPLRRIAPTIPEFQRRSMCAGGTTRRLNGLISTGRGSRIRPMWEARSPVT